jgi:bifunctional aspartokinase / homoserine dehydrogenase 1
MIVMKFGGTSVGTPATIRGLVKILLNYQQQGKQFTVVFSAFSKVTDTLIEMAQRAGKGDESWRQVFERVKERHFEAIRQLLAPDTPTYRHAEEQITANFESLENVLYGIFLLQEVSARSLDFVVSFGERNSACIIAQVMEAEGIYSTFLDTRKVVRTDAHFGSAKVDFEESNQKIKAFYAENAGKVVAATGFIGSTAEGLTTTLGRGGSDYTAAIIGAALDAQAIEIWTDVDGVLTADPRRVKQAFTMHTMTYREAMEMSHFGAKVIYPPTIQPAYAKNIPLVIKNTFNPDFEGTFVTNESEPGDFPVKGISSISQISLLTLQGSGLFGVPGIAGRLFGALARNSVNVVIITQGSSESSITFAVSPTQAKAAQKATEKEFSYEIREKLIEPMRIESDLAVLAIVGENMRYRPGISGQLFSALGKNGVNIAAIAQGSSELNISVVISAADETKALNAVHEAFFLSDTRTAHLYLVGVGLIGGTLLKQIQAQAAFLKEKRNLEIKLVGIANSRKMVLNAEGIKMHLFKEELEDGQPYSMHRFVETMAKFNLPNAIFVDCTASGEVASYYGSILDESISISTPNKMAASAALPEYRKLKNIANKRGVQWRYETNVGAGLPIITTLSDLIHSGDRIIRIEGILSGTLSFIFNSFCAPGATESFSSIVREAKRRGLTEPDPREDLSGADVRRKLLILGRETGLSLEATDVMVENILPNACVEAASVDAFFEALEQNDAHFDHLRQKAASEGKVLRFVAKLEDGVAAVVLQAFDQSHPFYFLSGSDNMVSFTTERYRDRPLVVRGPGAGAEVTAAGVFAEVIGMV